MTGVGRRNNSMNYMQVILQNLMSLTFSDVIDIAVVSFLIYQIVKLVRETSSTRIIRGVIILIAAMWLSSILQLLFNAADIVVVGKFAADNSLAAVGSNTALINLLTNLFIGLSIGANVVAARSYGAKAWDDLRDTVHTSMLLSMISGGLLMVLGVIGARQMLIWMQTQIGRASCRERV